MKTIIVPWCLCPVLSENRWGTNLNLQLQPWKRMRYQPVEFVDVGISSDNKELTRHGHSTTPCFTNENADLTCIYLLPTSIYCIWYCTTQRCWCDQNEAWRRQLLVFFLVVPSRRATIQGVESEQGGIGKLFSHKLRLWCSCTSSGCSHRMPRMQSCADGRKPKAQTGEMFGPWKNSLKNAEPSMVNCWKSTKVSQLTRWSICSWGGWDFFDPAWRSGWKPPAQAPIPAKTPVPKFRLAWGR